MGKDHVVWDEPGSAAINPELMDYERLYAVLAEGSPLVREEAIALCDAPAPMHLTLEPYEPGPEYEDRGRILVRYVTPDSQIGQIIVPESAKRPSGEMIVISTGHGAWNPETGKYQDYENLRVGDRIVVGRYSGQPIEIATEREWEEDGEKKFHRGKETYTVLSVNEIMGIYR